MPYEEKFLKRAVELSAKNIKDKSGGPFGAVIVKDGKIIGEGTNKVTTKNDPTAHAEVEAIRNACQDAGTFWLEGADIYASCEPCPMCLSAIYWAHVKNIYYANTRNQASEIGFNDSLIYEELSLEPVKRIIPAKHFPLIEAKKVFESWIEDLNNQKY